ncbi:RDD family protein [Sediminibacillus dalangtanensis]|uniref:RDD family protein n=1 Tax=Sediminibacillus dalangtanensis TaxID=2729421 RepID=A0ABX7VP81_9BACI|nr:RDD family protein [Sediminibacillus dalangtanensis]QTM98258.1 RDD family protein [Sediminibacillus dalangtanensis]
MEIIEPAGLDNRIVSRIIDAMIISLGTVLFSYLLYGDFNNGSEFRLTDFFGLLYSLSLPVLWYGYTLGRRLAGNRIVRIDGRKVGIGTMLLRDFVAGIFYVLTLGIGFAVSAFMVGIREDRRAIHDFIARTYVTKCTLEKNEDVS